MAPPKRHNVFVSYYHEDDQQYKERFLRRGKNVLVDKSVDTGDIRDTGLKTETIRQKIRDDYIRDATVTIVLIGPGTWQRKHVDWEIGSSLRATKKNSRCGLLGILLPNHPDYGKQRLNPYLLPPRLADNCKGADPYAIIHHWPRNWSDAQMRQWIQRAFARREGTPPNNKRDQFKRNRSGDPLRGWSQDLRDFWLRDTSLRDTSLREPKLREPRLRDRTFRPSRGRL